MAARFFKSLGEILRIVFIVYAALLFCFTYGIFTQQWWATDFWPVAYSSPLSYKLVSSFLAAAGASIFWAAWTRDCGAFAGIGLDSLTIGLPAGIYALRSKHHAMQSFGNEMLILAAVGLAVAAVAVWLPVRNKRPMPILVYVSFAIFTVALVTLGGMMARGSAHVLPWQTPADAIVLYGWMFIGAASYFLYGLLRPCRSNATGQLLGFLAYDLVLIVPFVVLFKSVQPGRLVNLIVYVAVIVYSGALAAWYLVGEMS